MVPASSSSSELMTMVPSCDCMVPVSSCSIIVPLSELDSEQAGRTVPESPVPARTIVPSSTSSSSLNKQAPGSGRVQVNAFKNKLTQSSKNNSHPSSAYACTELFSSSASCSLCSASSCLFSLISMASWIKALRMELGLADLINGCCREEENKHLRQKFI